jgi:hypothetical protein
MSREVRFIRVNGRVVPIKAKGSAPKGVSKRYGAKREKPPIKSIGVGRGAVAGAVAGTFAKSGSDLVSNLRYTKGEVGSSLKNAFRASNFSSGSLKNAAIGAFIGATIGSIKYTKRGKGESNKQVAMRVSGQKKNKTGV